jgi:5-formyltetrahydrofolate cyclo-ligase
MTVAAAKAALRLEMAARRDAMAPGERAAAAEAVARCAPAIAAVRGPTAAISGFLPIRSELDPRALMTALAALGASLCLPVVQSRGLPLAFRAWSPGDALDNGPWGIREPKTSAPVVIPDLMLVPLLAADRLGNRLGYGAGYYDRSIAALRQSGRRLTTIGLAFDQQIIDAVPHMPYDEPLTMLLTPSGLVAIGTA